MGLDTVELVMEVERAFDIQFVDDDLIHVRTVGDLEQAVRRKLAGIPRTPCPSQRAFHHLRAAALEMLGCERRAVRPATPLALLLPLPQRRAHWAALTAATALPLPALEHSPRFRRWRWCAQLAVAAATAFVLARTGAGGWSLLGAALTACTIVGVGANSALRAHAVHFPVAPATLGHLIRAVTPPLERYAVTAPGAVADDALWHRLCAIVVVQCGVSLDRIARSDSFFDDYGMN